ncbi:hypothetical protein GGS23DRAFT_236072 [Durotheca rogersii]|uniref:uncharacterized protein n=1 Tax=Durotheca rogersii TaxID=419775 RepID=UPI00222074A2|nr:uncharacterized protein GGS23DRAFT_236072 [Durotheca rogersii]KAI5860414.1 hypothetical protein GGS23DRAFT_236072 [Durotheca rogersii]
MNPIRCSRPLWAASRPVNILSRVGTRQPHPAQPSRASLYRRGRLGGARSFHLAPAAFAVVQGSQDLILSIHSLTHTPWFLTIPLVALGVSLFGRLPFHVYTRRIEQRRRKFNIILQAWVGRIGRDIQAEGVPPELREKEMTARYKRTVTRIYRALGLQEWKLYAGILGFPFWIVAIDSVRRLCGGPRGMLGSLLTGHESDTAATSAHASAAADAPAASPAALLPDPSIAVEGCLWFPDLTVPDPYHVLPAALSVVMVANLLPKTRAGLRKLYGLNPPGPPPTTPSGAPRPPVVSTPSTLRRNNVQHSLILVAALAGPLTAGLPAALHLYWLSSSVAAWATARALARLMPLHGTTLQRCTGVENFAIRPRPPKKPPSAQATR